jgi:L-cysteine desulfidase
LEEKLLSILKNQVVKALGCTEPAAVALAVARSREILNEEIESLEVYVNANVLKNGMCVGIPYTNEKGLVMACAIAMIQGKSSDGLEVLNNVDESTLQLAKNNISEDKIKLKVDFEKDFFYIDVRASSKDNYSQVIIRENHTNICYESLNDNIIKNETSLENKIDLKYEIKKYDIDDLIHFSRTVDIDKINFIKEGIDINLNLAQIGATKDLGIGLSKVYMKDIDDVYKKAKALTVCASEARMSGYPLSVMSSAGSGNHGLVAIIPLAVIGEGHEKSEEEIIRAVTLSHLVTIYVKSHIGTLTPICGCSVASGVGLSAGLTMLENGNDKEIKASINNTLAGVSGMFCDGAKEGCAYKLSISVTAAIEASNLAREGVTIPYDNGILGKTAEKSIENLHKVTSNGMKNVDREILEIMLEKLN